MGKLQGLEGQNYKLVYTVRPFDSNDKLFSESLKKSLYENCIKRVYREKEFNQNAALIAMQDKINQLYQMLIGSKAKSNLMSGYDHRNSVISNISSFSAINVDEDLESDTDTEYHQQFSNSSAGLSSIVEEAPRSGVRWSGLRGVVRRRDSNMSVGTMESELETVSDYIGGGR